MSPMVKSAVKPLLKAVRFVRAGYPDAAPVQGHIAALALLPQAGPRR
ncbi:hypothetical protein [Mycobacterium sp. ACS4331]|nr:hypothetical protein [Mycobacterium sp. ACS4331]